MQNGKSRVWTKKGHSRSCAPSALFLIVGVIRTIVFRRSALGIAALGVAAVSIAAVFAAASFVGSIAAGTIIVCICCVRRIISVVRTHDKLPPVMNIYRSSMRVLTENYTFIL